MAFSPALQGPTSWAMSELKDCPLQFHDFKSVDHLKVCPRYTAVLARSEDDGIGIEELDTLQLELETLLSSASRRLRVLEAETQVIPQAGDITRDGLCQVMEWVIRLAQATRLTRKKELKLGFLNT